MQARPQTQGRDLDQRRDRGLEVCARESEGANEGARPSVNVQSKAEDPVKDKITVTSAAEAQRQTFALVCASAFVAVCRVVVEVLKLKA